MSSLNRVPKDRVDLPRASKQALSKSIVIPPGFSSTSALACVARFFDQMSSSAQLRQLRRSAVNELAFRRSLNQRPPVTSMTAPVV